jgi:DNA polymerase/3'-5' exonuclease PolX
MKLRKTSFLLTFSEIEGGNRMKEYNKDLDIVFSPMSDETMSWLDELFSTCERFSVDYYNASEKDRVFVEAVARKNYGLKQASANGKAASTVEPFFGIHRAV